MARLCPGSRVLKGVSVGGLGLGHFLWRRSLRMVRSYLSDTLIWVHGEPVPPKKSSKFQQAPSGTCGCGICSTFCPDPQNQSISAFWILRRNYRDDTCKWAPILRDCLSSSTSFFEQLIVCLVWKPVLLRSPVIIS